MVFSLCLMFKTKYPLDDMDSERFEGNTRDGGPSSRKHVQGSGRGR
jgi:hypothetical protein